MTADTPNQQRSTPWRWWSKLLLALTILATLATVSFFAGPRNALGPKTAASRPLPPVDTALLDNWLQSGEATHSDIKPGNAKGISWQSASHQRTPWAGVYVHGFSASRLETAPVTDKVAKALGANAFHTRLTGHGPKDKRSELINGSWGGNIAKAVQGESRGWTPDNPQEDGAWTSHYPTRALFPMMALVKGVRDSDLSTFQTPVLVLYSDQDQTVDPVETQSAFARIGAPLKSMERVSYSKSKDQHVLAGAIKDPDAVAPMVESILKWTQSLPRQGN